MAIIATISKGIKFAGWVDKKPLKEIFKKLYANMNNDKDKIKDTMKNLGRYDKMFFNENNFLFFSRMFEAKYHINPLIIVKMIKI